MDRLDLGNRMKIYEAVSRNYLIRRMPVIIRIDGKAFHTFCRGLKKPYDLRLVDAMINTAYDLCSSIQGCKFAYTQSDEISLLLIDYDTLQTDAWFSDNVQKMVSIAASMTTCIFNKKFEHAKGQQAMFDARAFNLAKEEVCNYFIWRQGDCVRNSISSLAQSEFSHKRLQGLNCSQMQELLWQEKNINWNGCPTWQKRGFAVHKKDDGTWLINQEIPTFSADRDFIEKHVYIGE